MKFKIEISCDNDAFAENGLTEVGRILSKVADSMNNYLSGPIESSTFFERLYDYNGNKVGLALLEAE